MCNHPTFVMLFNISPAWVKKLLLVSPKKWKFIFSLHLDCENLTSTGACAQELHNMSITDKITENFMYMQYFYDLQFF